MLFFAMTTIGIAVGITLIPYAVDAFWYFRSKL